MPPKRGKRGPPYTDVPEEVYIVVTNPWGMSPDPRSRTTGDFGRIASWAKFVLQRAGLGGGRIATIECVYSMGTRDEIILQFSEGTDIIPLLGEHRWANIAKDWKGNPNDPRSTCVFIYNWRNNGDPADHNWTENYPKGVPLDTVPAKTPYPPPSWVQPPSTLTSFVHPIPRPLLPPPVPNDEHNQDEERQSTTSPPLSAVTPTATTPAPTPAPPEQHADPNSGGQPVAQDSLSDNLFRPYEPPSQHPSHAQFLDRQRTRQDEPSTSRSSPPPPKFIKKLDPYEMDEDALRALHSPSPGQEDIKEEDVKPTLSISVKLERPEVKIEDDDTRHNIPSGSDSRYQPSRALIDAVNSLPQPGRTPAVAPLPTLDPRRRPNGTQARSPASAGYQPSAELEAEINSFLKASPASAGYKPSAELETEINSFLLGATATSASASSGAPRSVSGTRVTAIKREYEEDPDVVASFGEGKKIKIEEY